MIKIEVTGNSIPEVADKLLAIGANLKGNAIVDGAKAAVDYMKTVASKPVDPVMPEVAEMAAADPTPAPSAEEPAPSTTADTSASADVPPESASSTASATPADALEFDKDVAPHVLRLVKDKGKPAAEEILTQFGVAKASQLDPAMWPELVEALKAAL